MADRRLQVFHTVSRMMSFTKAAEALQMTQPAVTFQVRQLEEHLNVRLFDRSHNKIDLTEAGKRVYQYAERIFSLYSEMENSIREITRDVCGVLRIGASATAAEYSLPELIAAFQQKHPGVHIKLKVANSNSVVSMVENSIVDLGVVDTPIKNKKLSLQHCHNDEFVLVVPAQHELSRLPSVPVAQLINYPWIMRDDEAGARDIIFHYLEQAGQDPDNLRIVMELSSPEAMKGAIAAGSGIAILPRSSIQKELQLGTLQAVSLSPLLERPLTLVYKKQKFPLCVMDELLAFMGAHFANEQPVSSPTVAVEEQS